MQISLATILIALGSAGLVTQRTARVALGALVLQWAGIVLRASELGLSAQVVSIEAVVAAASCVVLGISVWRNGGDRTGTATARGNRPLWRAAGDTLGDQLWLWAIMLVAGVAGYGLATTYPLGMAEGALLPFYWTLLPALLALVIDGSRDGTKLALALLSVANAGVLLLYTLDTAPLSVGLLGLISVGRIALATALAYVVALLAVGFGANLGRLFDLRDAYTPTETALTIVEQTEEAGRD